MNWSASVLTSISSDTEPSIIVTFHTAKYIFNTSENTTRSFLQSGRLWRRTRALFYTQARVEKTSGLPGLVMTFADATLSDLQLHGPQGLKHILASMRLYTFRDSMKVQPYEIPWISLPSPTPTPCYVDENLKVYAIPVLPFPTPTFSLNTTVSELPFTEPLETSFMETSAETTGKRKRETSPYSPQKRLNPGNLSSETAPISFALLTEMRKADFRPETLTGEAADEYREVVIRQMFPGTNLNTQIKTGKKPVSEKDNGKAGSSSTRRSTSPSRSNAASKKADADDNRRFRTPLPAGFTLQLPEPSFTLPPSKSPPAISYLLVGPQYRGKFNADKAKALGIPAGTLRSRLARGETVTFDVQENGATVQRTVRSEEVVAKSEAPGVIVILDVPSVAHIPALVASFRDSEFYRKFWSEDPSYFNSPDPEYTLRLAYHMCGEGVLENESYKAFMNGFGPAVHHIISSREHCPDPITFTSAAYNQLRMSKLDDKIFHMPKYSLTPKTDIATIPGLPSNSYPMNSNITTNLRPWIAPAPDPEVVKRDKFHPVLLGAEPLVFSSAMQESMKAAKMHVEQVILTRQIKPTPGADVGIIPLGTGGSLPSKYRNVLSTLVTIPGWGNILLDAGEGTWGQIARNYGLGDSPYNAWQALRDLKCIFVSHMHADHHIGLAHIIVKRRQLDPPPTEPLYVVSIRGIHLYLRELNAVQDLGINDPSGNGVIPVLSESLYYRTKGNKYAGEGVWQIGGNEPWLDFQTSVDNARNMCNSLGLEAFKTADVYHRCRCYGVTFKHKDGWSVTFSGDTAPSEGLRRIGMNTTVLIHEASMADMEAEVAKKKAHSTISQAIEEGKKMQAKNILLTHFSARYPKMPPYLTQRNPTARHFDTENVIVPAFDHANFNIGDMWKMQFYMSSVNHNFDDTYDKNDDDEMVITAVDNVSRA
ncbi:hypothetical protein GALMADRAFT_153220 [Galerina marginata CBS 339.88]|uniref:ribonuclease Z n=1 Tax=Galerina marginata (strain CBS 339.88) TaxID=685588 RepID=A0A067TLJ5_GALM3|nr:hypothetical protein GALMADRAFT_153220 [Galerina marginata CBS 339.88]